MVRFLSFLIKLYQKAISQFLPRTCRFYPTCSSYALQSLEKYGVIKGAGKALIRIARCSPLSKGGYDPLK